MIEELLNSVEFKENDKEMGYWITRKRNCGIWDGVVRLTKRPGHDDFRGENGGGVERIGRRERRLAHRGALQFVRQSGRQIVRIHLPHSLFATCVGFSNTVSPKSNNSINYHLMV